MSDLNGNLASFGVRQVLELLSDSGKTGELQLSSGTVVGRALFHDGLIAYATTASGVDTVEELEALLERHAAPDAHGSVDSALREQPETPIP